LDISTSRTSGQTGLAALVSGPIVVLVGLLLFSGQLPGVECGEGGGASSLELTAFYVLCGFATLACLIAATARLAALWRGRGEGPGARLRSRLAVALPPLFIAAIVVLALAGVDSLVAAGFVAGAVATGVALAILVFAWAQGRSVEDVGVLVPVYLLGAGLVCYPALLVLVAVGQSGSGC
jgi:hypothetical protein